MMYCKPFILSLSISLSLSAIKCLITLPLLLDLLLADCSVFFSRFHSLFYFFSRFHSRFFIPTWKMQANNPSEKRARIHYALAKNASLLRFSHVFGRVFAHKPYQNATPTHSVISALEYVICVIIHCPTSHYLLHSAFFFLFFFKFYCSRSTDLPLSQILQVVIPSDFYLPLGAQQEKQIILYFIKIRHLVPIS